MKCNHYWCNEHAKKNGFCNICNKKNAGSFCYVRNCKNKIKENFKCSFHLEKRSIALESLNIYYDCVDPRPFHKLSIYNHIFINTNDNFYFIFDFYAGFYIFDINGNPYPAQNKCFFPKKNNLYGPVILKDKIFLEIEDIDKLLIKNIDFDDAKDIINKNNNAIIIQKFWRLCRYDPKYKMCNKVLINNLKDLGAL